MKKILPILLILLICLISLTVFCQDNKVKFEKDKLYHFVAGAVISGAGTYFVYKVTKKENLSFFCGLLAGAGANFAKEYLWDKKLGRGTFNKNDIIAGCIGSFTGAITVTFIIDIKRNKKILSRY